MNELDSVIESFESSVASRGIQSVHPRDFLSDQQYQACVEGRRSEITIAVELVRVWIEFQWKIGQAVSVADAKQLFSEIPFSQEDLQCFQYEIDRQSPPTSTTNQRLGKLEDLPALGTVWHGFRLMCILGEGAFARVYLARQEEMADRWVALKLTFRETQESYFLAKLNHPSIVPVYSVHRSGKVSGICMPYLGNTTLADVQREVANRLFTTRTGRTSTIKLAGSQLLRETIHQRHSQIDTLLSTDREPDPIAIQADASTNANDKERDKSESKVAAEGSIDSRSTRFALENPLYEKCVLEIGHRIASALAHAHSFGILHCDLKPANILLDQEGQPRLLDFNVAMRIEYEASHEALGGTLPYMSPEQRRAMTTHEMVDHRSDIYSLGVVLCELLTGKLPSQWTAGNGLEASQTNSFVQGIRRANPNITPAMAAILAKCLATQPDDRYASALHLREDLLAQCMDQPLVHIAEPNWIERASKWNKRHPRLSIAGKVGIASALIMVALWSVLWWRGNELNRLQRLQQVQVLNHRLPENIAMITSLRASPRLAGDALFQLEETTRVVLDSQGKINSNLQRSLRESSDPQTLSMLRTLVILMQSDPWPKSYLKTIETERLQSLHTQWESIRESLAWLDNISAGNQLDQQNLTLVAKAIQERKWEQAVETLEGIVAANPRDYASQWLLGDCRMQLRRWDAAIQCYTTCISLRPEVAVAYFNRGNCRWLMEQYAPAADDYASTLLKDPKFKWAHLNRGLALQQTGQLPQALEEVELLLQEDGASVSSYRLAYELAISLQLEKKAKAYLEKALNYPPHGEQDWIDRGLLELGIHPQNAEAAFLEAEKANPNSVDAQQKLAYLYSEVLPNHEQCLVHLAKAIELEPSNATHWAGRAVVHARRGAIDKALQDLNQCEQIFPREGIVQYQIACGYALVWSKMVGSPSSREDSALPSDVLPAQDCLVSALRWVSKSLQNDPRVRDILPQDDDMKALRETPEFQQLWQAFRLMQTPDQPNVRGEVG